MKLQPLYVHRPLIQSDDFVAHYLKQGSPSIDPSKLHVTICYSVNPVDWESFEPNSKVLSINPFHRRISHLGKMLVMEFKSGTFQKRHNDFTRNGASWDFPSYRPHISLFETEEPNFFQLKPFRGILRFGPEQFEELDDERVN